MGGGVYKEEARTGGEISLMHETLLWVRYQEQSR